MIIVPPRALRRSAPWQSGRALPGGVGARSRRRAMADLHPSLIKYVVTMVASVPVSYGQRAMPNATARYE